MKRLTALGLGTTALVVVLSLEAWSQQPQSGEPFILQTYEVGDLLIEIRDHAYDSGDPFGRKSSARGSLSRGGYGGGERLAISGLTPEQEEGRRRAATPGRITMEDLMYVVVSTVHPQSWHPKSGAEGRIEMVGSALVVWQKASVHEQIAELLTQLSQASQERRTFTIDARWLTLDADELSRLVDEENQIDREALEELSRRPTTIRGKTHCFSGQLVYLVSGTTKNVVSGYIPVVGQLDEPRENERQVASRESQGPFRLAQYRSGSGSSGEVSVGYQPIVERPNVGALLEIRPTMTRGAETAVIDLKSTLTSHDPESDTRTERAATLAPEVDRMAYHVQELATTFRVQLGEPMLVGGLTYAPRADRSANEAGGDGNGSETRPQIYLVLELREGS